MAKRSLAGGRTLQVAYTPGHASHHVSYFEPSTRIAFVGDTAGIRRRTGKYIMPASPPPDVDLEQWRESEAKILAWEPDTLFLTHFGPFNGARQHFHELMSRMDEWGRPPGVSFSTSASRRRSVSSNSSPRRSWTCGVSSGSPTRNSTAAPEVLRIRGTVWPVTGGSGRVMRCRGSQFSVAGFSDQPVEVIRSTSAIIAVLTRIK